MNNLENQIYPVKSRKAGNLAKTKLFNRVHPVKSAIGGGSPLANQFNRVHPVKSRKTGILAKTKLFNRVNWLLQEKYLGNLTNKAKKDIKKLKAGEPVDYLIGFINFLDCKIDLSKKPLIPRIETEYWVGEVIYKLKIENQNTKIKILDVFSGSGAIGIAILKQISFARVVFADSEENCLKQIKINCRINKISKNRYKIIKSDVFKNVNGKFDYIFTNPPYIPTKRINKIQNSVLKYEPHIALFGGEDGLFYIERFLTEAKSFINPRGPSLPVPSRLDGVRASKIYMEFDSIQKKQIEKLLKKLNYKDYQFKRDQYKKWRYLCLDF